jgi:hypothetical protein
MDDAVTPVPRERGWRRLVSALAGFLLLPALPLVSTALPVSQTLLMVVAAIAVCTLLGWRNGGRLWLAVVWCVLAAWMVAQSASPDSSYDRLARGWTLLLVAAFGVVTLVGGSRTFFSRALATVALALAIAGGVLVLTPQGPQRVASVVREELGRRSAEELARWEASRAEAERQGVLAGVPAADSLLDESERSVQALPGAVSRVLPALLALESLAALAIAWSLYHRVSRTRIGPALAPLREFRFNDQLVWGLIVGITALLLPTLEGVRGPGLNLLVFFGALYALRGLGVLTWFLTPRRPVTGVLVGLALVLLLRDGAAFALGLVGVGDTWLDWRGRARGTT